MGNLATQLSTSIKSAASASVQQTILNKIRIDRRLALLGHVSGHLPADWYSSAIQSFTH
jgi:hypothetical protein